MSDRVDRHDGRAWPVDAATLAAVQRRLAAATPAPWRPAGDVRVGGCWVCFPRGTSGPGASGDPAWAGAVLVRAGRVVDRVVGRVVDQVLDQAVVEGVAAAPYTPGLMALRAGPLLELVVRSLAGSPDVLMLDATGRDHPRGAGLATHLGAVLDVPTVGVTHRPLVAEGPLPGDGRGARSRLTVGDDTVACWLRTRAGVRPLVVHPGWRVDLDTALDVVLRTTTSRHRTPEPLRQARHLARRARAASEATRRD